MEIEKEVHKGILFLPTTAKLLLKKSWQNRFCYLYKASKFGIQRLEVYDTSEKTTLIRIITLEDCIKITPESDLRFTILTKTSSCPYEFSALNQDEKTIWLNHFQSVAFPDDLSNITSIQEDNDLYMTSGTHVFNVKIRPTDASIRCQLDPNLTYALILTSNAIQLKTYYLGPLLYTWPYCFIRRYGYKSGEFTFEAGRKCHSGEGIFSLEHPNQQEIFRCLCAKMKSMKKLLSKDESILDCGENQLHAALTMEARSRSPLPPSPTSSTSLHDVEPKSYPAKPPRKSLKNLPDYEAVDKYDRIEYRNDAWRTLGLGEVKHTENVGEGMEEEDEVYMSWGDQKFSNNSVQNLNKAPKIIRQLSKDDNYDKLDFFGSSTKLNSGYKQVSVASGSSAMVTPPSFNDYDEVQPAIEEIRLADDKHLGYALVRKGGGKEVDHQFHNEEAYAVISKPKRV